MTRFFLSRLVVAVLSVVRGCGALRVAGGRTRLLSTALRAADGGDGEDYVNPVTALLGRSLKKPRGQSAEDQSEWAARKRPARSLEAMRAQLDRGLRDREWFVTGRVLPELFADDFKFEDPDVKLEGIENYARGVARLFDSSSRCEVVFCEADEAARTVDVAWRLAAKVNLGPGLVLKPYLVLTELQICEGLVVFQRDRFAIPSWEILLSAVAPWAPFVSPPAPSVGDPGLEAQARGLLEDIRRNRRDSRAL